MKKFESCSIIVKKLFSLFSLVLLLVSFKLPVQINEEPDGVCYNAAAAAAAASAAGGGLRSHGVGQLRCRKPVTQANKAQPNTSLKCLSYMCQLGIKRHS